MTSVGAEHRSEASVVAADRSRLGSDKLLAGDRM